MPTANIQISLRVDPDVYEKMKLLAEAKHSSLKSIYDLAFNQFIKANKVFLSDKLRACNQPTE